MAEYPLEIFEQRSIENLPGLTYDANKKKILFAEDIQALGDEITALEVSLGLSPQGTFESVVARLEDIEERLSALE
jgi:hypothetical protein